MTQPQEDPPELTTQQNVALAMLSECAVKLKTAMDEGYLDESTFELNPDMRAVTRPNGNLLGGFNGDYTWGDLAADREFMLNFHARNSLLGELGLPPYDVPQLVGYISGMSRPRQKKNRITSNKQTGEEWRKGTWHRAIKRISAHTRANPRTVAWVYLTLWSISKGQKVEGHTQESICALANISRKSAQESLAVLEQLRLIEKLPPAQGAHNPISYRLLHV